MNPIELATKFLLDYLATGPKSHLDMMTDIFGLPRPPASEDHSINMGIVHLHSIAIVIWKMSPFYKALRDLKLAGIVECFQDGEYHMHRLKEQTPNGK